MNTVLVDSSLIIDFLRQREKSNTPLVMLLQGDLQLSISIVTYFEGYAGKSVWEKEQAKNDIDMLFAGMEVLGLDTTIAQKAGELRARYGLSAMDAIIAATASYHNLPLATINRKDFERVPELALQQIS